MWLGRREKRELVLYVKRDDVIFLLDVLIWLLYEGWAWRQKRVDQNEKLGEEMRVWAKGNAVEAERKEQICRIDGACEWAIAKVLVIGASLPISAGMTLWMKVEGRI